MRRDDHSYFIRRAAEERAAADRATCPRVVAAHREMAERYAELAELMPSEVVAATATATATA
jgi:hypothetical protein